MVMDIDFTSCIAYLFYSSRELSAFYSLLSESIEDLT